MSRNRSKVKLTDPAIIVSELRGEIGEIITSWLLYRHFLFSAHAMQTDDYVKDAENAKLNVSWILIDKLERDIVSRLSELAGKKFGRINFFFASRILNILKNETNEYEQFIEDAQFLMKRNKHISHKELPIRWEDFRAEPQINYRTLLQAIAKALRLMKKIDDNFIGTSAKYLWIEMKKRRKDTGFPGKLNYTLMPYFRLSNEVRVKIVFEEQNSGKQVWETIDTKLNGSPVKVRACKQWGIVILSNKIVVLPQYPLISLDEIRLLDADGR